MPAVCPGCGGQQTRAFCWAAIEAEREVLTVRRGRLLGQVFAGAAVAGAMVLGLAAAAGGSQPVIHGSFSDAGSFQEPDFCGIAVEVDWTETGHTVVRPVRGSEGQAYFGHTNFEFTEVLSTSAGSITVVTRAVFHEQRAAHVEGDVWRFEWVHAGTVSVYDSAGRSLLRQSGVIKAAQRFDTLGDGAPGGQPVPGTFEILSQHGRTFDDDTFCGTALPHLT